MQQASWGRTFTALKYPNYRLWFFGQMVSLFGTWMQGTAQGYLVYELTQSTAYLGYVSFASGVPAWLLTLYGGVIADRVSRRNLMVVTQTAMMLLAFVLAALTFLNLVQPWHIMLLALALGVAQAFDAPARQSFVVEMVERKELTNAIALNAAMFNTATALGPAVGGLTYAAFGPGWCFTLNGLSFIAIIVGLVLMRLSPIAQPPRRTSAAADLAAGVRYVMGQPVILSLILLVGGLTLFGMSFGTLIPAWAVQILGGDARTNGWLMSARGVGSLMGALALASLGRFKFKGRLLTLGMFVFPVMVLIFAFVRWLPLALLVLAGAGVSNILVLNLANALVQMQISDELRGRVMGIYTWVFFGAMPLGGLLAGAVAQRIGAPLTVIGGALASLGVAVLVWVVAPQVRQLE